MLVKFIYSVTYGDIHYAKGEEASLSPTDVQNLQGYVQVISEEENNQKQEKKKGVAHDKS